MGRVAGRGLRAGAAGGSGGGRAGAAWGHGGGARAGCGGDAARPHGASGSRRRALDMQNDAGEFVDLYVPRKW